MGIDWFMKLMFVFCSFALKFSGFSFDLLEQQMTAHFGMHGSIPALVQY